MTTFIKTKFKISDEKTNIGKYRLAALKWTYGRFGIDYRVASLLTRYITAIGIIPKSLKSIGRF